MSIELFGWNRPVAETTVSQDLSNDGLLTSLEELDLAPEEKSFSDSDEQWLDGI